MFIGPSLSLYQQVAGGFNPSSIAGLRQQLLVSTSMSGSTIFDDRAGLGTTRAAQPGRAYDFDGTDDKVVHSSTISLTGAFSFSCWLYMDDLSTLQTLFASSGSDYLAHVSATQFRVRIGGVAANITHGHTFTTGAWQHLVVTRDASNVCRVYRNAVAPTTTDTQVGTLDFEQIGAFGASSFPYNGKMFDVRVYDDQLTEAEITHLYNFGLSGTDPGLANIELWYKCDDTNSTAAYDSSGNANHGTKTNITVATFHYSGADVPYSFQNEVGFTDDVTNGLVPRNEASTANDVLGATLEYSGKAPINAALVGSACADFDGTNDAVLLPTAGIDLTDFTVSAWINPDDLTSTVLFGSSVAGSDYIRITTTSVVFRAGGSNYTITTDPDFVTGSWQHFMLTRSGSTITAYRNGVSIGSTTAVTTSYNINRIGVFGTSSFPWNGKVADVRVFSDVLTSDERTWVYTNGASGTDPTAANLELHLPLAEGAGITTYDISGNSNHGTATNITPASFWGTTQDVYHYNILSGYNQSYKFDGVDDYFNTGFQAFPSAGRVDCWFTYSVAGSDFDFLFATQDATPNRVGIHIPSTGNTLIYLGALAGASKATGFELGDTVKLSLVWDGAEAWVEVDDVQVDTKSAYTATVTTTLDMLIGARNRTSIIEHHSPQTIHRLRVLDASDATLYDTLTDGWGTPNSAPEAVRLPVGVLTGINDRPAGVWHNGAETKIDFTGGVAIPGTSGWETAWAFHDTRTNPLFNRERTTNSIITKADRFLAYSTALSGADLTAVQAYTATIEG